MAIALRNVSDRLLTFSLYHGVYCVGGGPCRCTGKEMRRPVRLANGATRFEIESRRIAVTLDIPAGDSVQGLHPAVMKVPQIKTALEAGDLIKVVVGQPTEVKSAEGTPRR